MTQEQKITAIENRDIKLGNFLDSIELKTKQICREFEQFTDGARMLILLERKKDGGHNKEERRNLGTKFSFSSEEFAYAVKELLLLRLIYPESRLYSSANQRDVKKVIHKIETELLDVHYSNDEEKNTFTYKKLIKSPRHFFMQQANAQTKLFVLDVDDVEGEDLHDKALRLCAELEVEIVKSYRTKNGWHIVTEPFNPALWTVGEVKKDALLLLDY